MSIDGDDKEFQALAQRLRDGMKTIKEGVAGGEHSLREDDDLKSNGTAEEVKVRQGSIVEAPAVQHIPQQQPQGAIWERFLHLRSLKVLLVEIDDSTRHVVAALLRNCSYEGLLFTYYQSLTGCYSYLVRPRGWTKVQFIVFLNYFLLDFKCMPGG